MINININIYEIFNALSMIPGGITSIRLSRLFYKKGIKTNNLKDFEYSTAVSSYSIVCMISIMYHLSCAFRGKERSSTLMYLDYYAQQITGLLHILAWNSHKNTANHIYVYILMMVAGRIMVDERNLFICQCVMCAFTLKRYTMNPWWLTAMITRLASYRHNNQSAYHSMFHISVTYAFLAIWRRWY